MLKIDYPIVESAVRENHAQEWFIYAHKDWDKRYHVKRPLAWIADHVSNQSRILETGCGVGINLLWLYEQGFSNLAGLDHDPSAIAAAHEIAEKSGYDISYDVDDGIDPASLSGRVFEVIIALNWLYHVPGLDLKNLLARYHSFLSADGYLIFDCVDSSYNRTRNNEFNTSDWKKPCTQRRPSEYTIRFSRSQVRNMCSEVDLEVVHVFSKRELIKRLANSVLRKYAIVPRNVFVVQRRR